MPGKTLSLSGVRCLGVICACGAVVALVGCSSGSRGVRDTGSEPVEIAASDFVGDPSAGSVSGRERAEDGGGTPGDVGTEEPDSARPDLVARDESLDELVARARESEGLGFIDAKVGDISGKPIYVSSFFAPIEDRLVALAATSAPQDWQREMIEIVRTRLDAIIFDELLRAETLAGLSVEQRTGLQAFLNEFRETLLSENLGSAQLADRRIQEQQGISLDEALRQKELDTLVGLTLYNEINRRINVSWRDIKNRYERDYERFNPDPTVVLRVIRVLEGAGELTDSITARLEGGESFGSIAESEINTYNRDSGGVVETTIEGAFSETAFFALAPLNEAVWALGADAEGGDWTGPVDLGNATFWIEYVRTERESRSLYDAQLTIYRELTEERRAEERREYLDSLMERARVSTREEILVRLLYVAQRLYGPSGR